MDDEEIQEAIDRVSRRRKEEAWHEGMKIYNAVLLAITCVICGYSFWHHNFFIGIAAVIFACYLADVLFFHIA